jgi:DnaJ homolog subfamily C member 7
MTNKKNKAKKKSGPSMSMESTPVPQSPSPTPPNGDASGSNMQNDGEMTGADESDPIVLAEKTKEKGNEKFKAGKYAEAVELYSKAIGEFLLQFLLVSVMIL